MVISTFFQPLVDVPWQRHTQHTSGDYLYLTAEHAEA